MLSRYGPVCADKGALDVAQHRVDPLKGAGLQGFVSSGSHWLVGDSLTGYRCKTAKSICDNKVSPDKKEPDAAPMAALVKPEIRCSFIRWGLPSSVVSTAATKGTFPAEPRPRLPTRLPPMYASSISTRPVRCFTASRSCMTCIILFEIFHAVFCVTPKRRASSRLEISSLV